ncbi:carboxypeptidase regulatory-like domain-containing protein [Granulicella arctica]|uniref:Plastocyanin n=1 Tax=Granulicella arctica TaxID=940613 RepID=A0A7Y9PGK6_9BACT|nr:carboxypeptidase regulatory-like domain-containing protein [Granulicella arctica]NYF79457.1 plastocyanin [Granulicella arctica]
MKRLSGLVCAALVLCLVQGCKSKEAPSGASTSEATPASAPQAQAAPLDPATLGEVSGTIRLKGKPPVPVKIDTSMDPACGMSGSAAFTSEQYVVNDGKLANVYVYVKSGPGMIRARITSGKTPSAVLDQKGCRYTPHVIAIEAGDYVEFRNSDVTMHNIHTMPTVVGNEAIDISQGPKGTPVIKQFPDAEVMLPVRCNNHPWMNAFINISATPFFAVTDAFGQFDLKGLPAGQYVLGAVQEKLGEQTLTVTVPAKGTAKGDFTFTMK